MEDKEVKIEVYEFEIDVDTLIQDTNTMVEVLRVMVPPSTKAILALLGVVIAFWKDSDNGNGPPRLTEELWMSLCRDMWRVFDNYGVYPAPPPKAN